MKNTKKTRPLGGHSKKAKQHKVREGEDPLNILALLQKQARAQSGPSSADRRVKRTARGGVLGLKSQLDTLNSAATHGEVKEDSVQQHSQVGEDEAHREEELENFGQEEARHDATRKSATKSASRERKRHKVSASEQDHKAKTAKVRKRKSQRLSELKPALSQLKRNKVDLKNGKEVHSDFEILSAMSSEQSAEGPVLPLRNLKESNDIQREPVSQSASGREADEVHGLVRVGKGKEIKMHDQSGALKELSPDRQESDIACLNVSSSNQVGAGTTSAYAEDQPITNDHPDLVTKALRTQTPTNEQVEPFPMYNSKTTIEQQPQNSSSQKAPNILITPPTNRYKRRKSQRQLSEGSFSLASFGSLSTTTNNTTITTDSSFFDATSLMDFDIPSTPPSSCHFSVSEIISPLGSPTPVGKSQRKQREKEQFQNITVGKPVFQGYTSNLGDESDKENIAPNQPPTKYNDVENDRVAGGEYFSLRYPLNTSDTFIDDKDRSFFFHRAPSARPRFQRQLYLNFPNMAPKKQTCRECFMAYVPSLKADEAVHRAYHQKYLGGLVWQEGWGKKVPGKVLPPKLRLMTKTSLVQRDGYVREVQLGRRGEVRTVLALLRMVNTELNAPKDWLTLALGGEEEAGKVGLLQSNPQDRRSAVEKATDQGKVFVYVYNRKVIGMLSLEKIDTSKSGTKLMDVATQDVVALSPESTLVHKLPRAFYGISRVFVLKKYRRNSVALILLYTALNEAVYGMRLNKYQLSWSQPSFLGLCLAKKFNLITDTRSKRQFLNVYIEGE